MSEKQAVVALTTATTAPAGASACAKAGLFNTPGNGAIANPAPATRPTATPTIFMTRPNHLPQRSKQGPPGCSGGPSTLVGRSLVRHVDDLDAAVFRRGRILRIFE